MTGDTKQEILYNALMKLKEQFEATQQWSSDRTDLEKGLVAGNLNGFIGFLSQRMPEEAEAYQNEICKEMQSLVFDAVAELEHFNPTLGSELHAKATELLK